MDLPQLRRTLLELFGTVAVPQLGGLSEADWAWLDTMAKARRLQPLLHVQHRDNPQIPAAIAARWQAAHREAALAALARKAELGECVALLEQAGLQVLALKGAWLAHYAYPDPAQRPMYDIDLLLDPDTVIAGWELLKQAGFVQAYPAEMSLTDLIRFEKHLPALVGPRGSMIEVHHRLWERAGRLDHASPASDDAAIRARAVTLDGIRYPAPPDMLVHLIIHAAYSHRLDCGPRVLADIDFLLRREAIDWTAFWQRAAAEGWSDGARLVLELTRRNRAGMVIDFAPDAGGPVPENVIDGAVQLLFQDPDSCASAGFTASVINGGVKGLVQRMLGRRSADGEASARRDTAAAGGRLGWASSRLIRVAGDIARSDIRRQAGQLAQLSRWLDR